MYERALEGSFQRNCGGNKSYAGISLCADFLSFYFGDSPGDFFICLFWFLIYPVIDGNGSFCVLLYFVSQAQAWHMALTQYVMQRRRTNIELFCYAALLLIIALNPCQEFIHICLCLVFVCVKCQVSDTIISISRQVGKNKTFLIKTK